MAKAAKKNTPRPKTKRRAAKSRKPRVRVASFEVDSDPATQLTPQASKQPSSLPDSLSLNVSPDVLNRLWTIIDGRREADPEVSHSARLLARGTARVAQKLGEEAIECLIEAVAGSRAGLIAESADLLYHLLITWVSVGIRPEEVWYELQKREKVSHLTEGADVPLRRLLGSVQVRTTKIP